MRTLLPIVPLAACPAPVPCDTAPVDTGEPVVTESLWITFGAEFYYDADMDAAVPGDLGPVRVTLYAHRAIPEMTGGSAGSHCYLTYEVDGEIPRGAWVEEHALVFGFEVPPDAVVEGNCTAEDALGGATLEALFAGTAWGVGIAEMDETLDARIVQQMASGQWEGNPWSTAAGIRIEDHPTPWTALGGAMAWAEGEDGHTTEVDATALPTAWYSAFALFGLEVAPLAP